MLPTIQNILIVSYTPVDAATIILLIYKNFFIVTFAYFLWVKYGKEGYLY
jgi:hypothetical protein